MCVFLRGKTLIIDINHFKLLLALFVGISNHTWLPMNLTYLRDRAYMFLSCSTLTLLQWTLFQARERLQLGLMTSRAREVTQASWKFKCGWFGVRIKRRILSKLWSVASIQTTLSSMLFILAVYFRSNLLQWLLWIWVNLN